MDPENRYARDIFNFSNRFLEAKAFDVLKNKTNNLGKVKASFGMEVHFKRERTNFRGEIVEEKQRHYFKEDPHIFTKQNLVEDFLLRFESFVDEINSEIENWSEQGLGWAVDGITIAYVNVARYQPLRGGTYTPTPPKLAAKKAIKRKKQRRRMFEMAFAGGLVSRE